MLNLYCERAQLADGQNVLELGCGWGSLSMFMAAKYPNSRITGVSNSTSQRAFIMEECRHVCEQWIGMGERFDGVHMEKKFKFPCAHVHMGFSLPNSQAVDSQKETRISETLGAAALCRKRKITNLEIRTSDMNVFTIDQKFDRIVSVEMFEVSIASLR